MEEIEEPIAQGATATLHPYGNGTVLKWYRAGFAADEAEREAHKAQFAFAAGVRTPFVHETITIAGRPGIVFDRVNGFPLLARMFGAKEYAAKDMALMATLHADLHTKSGDGLPVLQQRLADKIQAAELPDDLRQFVLTRLGDLCQTTANHVLCHGDFHPLNILLDNDVQTPVIIDWVDATCGVSLADVARTALLLKFAVLPDNLPQTERDWLTRERAGLADIYLNTYHAIRPFDWEDFGEWLVVVAAARRHDRIPPIEKERMQGNHRRKLRAE